MSIPDNPDIYYALAPGSPDGKLILLGQTPAPTGVAEEHQFLTLEDCLESRRRLMRETGWPGPWPSQVSVWRRTVGTDAHECPLYRHIRLVGEYEVTPMSHQPSIFAAHLAALGGLPDADPLRVLARHVGAKAEGDDAPRWGWSLYRGRGVWVLTAGAVVTRWSHNPRARVRMCPALAGITDPTKALNEVVMWEARVEVHQVPEGGR